MMGTLCTQEWPVFTVFWKGWGTSLVCVKMLACLLWISHIGKWILCLWSVFKVCSFYIFFWKLNLLCSLYCFSQAISLSEVSSVRTANIEAAVWLIQWKYYFARNQNTKGNFILQFIGNYWNTFCTPYSLYTKIGCIKLSLVI